MTPRLLLRQAALRRARAALDLEEAELLEAAAAELAAEPPRPRPGSSLAVDLLAVLLGACEGAQRVGDGTRARVA
mgnify:CR=1 FL=1